MQNTEHFKEKLEAEKKKLETELSGVGRRNPSNPSDWEPTPPADSDGPEADPIDIADTSIGFDTNASIVADLETRYNEVLSALSRIEDGSYGTCKGSGEPIEEARLEADPAAATCITHKDVP